MHMGHCYQLIAPERITRTAGLSLKPGLAEHLAEERLVSERGPPLMRLWPRAADHASVLVPCYLATRRPMKYTGRLPSRGGW